MSQTLIFKNKRKNIRYNRKSYRQSGSDVRQIGRTLFLTEVNLLLCFFHVWTVEGMEKT